VNPTDRRLDQIRGPVRPQAHNARTIAALTSNPGCARRGVLDAAGVDKQRLADRVGFPAPFGQSQFAITRGNAFEATVKANGCAELLRLLREHLRLPIPEVAYDDLNTVGGNESLDARYIRSRRLLSLAVTSADGAGTLFDHPLLRLGVAGRWVYLEPDLVAFRLRDRFHIVEIKSFPVIDGRGDPAKVAAAATQSAVYVLAMRELMLAMNIDPSVVSDEVFLVCPENFSNRPIATPLDVRRQLTTVGRQISRLARVDTLVAALPHGLTLDLRLDARGESSRPVGELVDALRHIDARYAPECLSTCEMGFFCRAEGHGATASLGRQVQEDLGGIDTVAAAVALATGNREPAEDQAEAVQRLRVAEQLRRACLGGAA
jgi:hypothetical protein